MTIDLGLVHEAGGAGIGQRHRMDGVVERLQDRVGPDRDAERGVGQFVAEEAQHPRRVDLQGAPRGSHHLVERRLAEPGIERVAVHGRRRELPAAHRVQEFYPANPHRRGMQLAGKSGRILLARADDDGGATIKPAEGQGALQDLAQVEPALRRFDRRDGGALARPFTPFAHHVVGHDVDDFPGQPVAAIHGVDLAAAQTEHEEAVVRRLVLAGVERGGEVR